MKKSKKFIHAIKKFNKSRQWFRNFILSSLCAAAVSMPSGAWGGGSVWYGKYKEGNGFQQAELTEALSIEDGVRKGNWDPESGDVPVGEIQDIYGSYAVSNDNSADAKMSGVGSINISGTADFIIPIYAGYAKAENGTATASNNKLTISGGKFANLAWEENVNVIAGYAEASTAVADHNKLTISGGTFGLDTEIANPGDQPIIAAGYAHRRNTQNENGTVTLTASDNELTISGGTFYQQVYAGFAEYAQGGALTNDSSTVIVKSENNTLTISGGTFYDSVFAGSAYSHYDCTLNSSNNKMIIKSSEDGTNPNLEYADLYGGLVKAEELTGTETISTGNTLKIYTKGLRVQNVANFQKYQFILPENIQKDDIVLTIIGTENTDVKGAEFAVAVKSGAVLNQGDTIQLIKQSGADGATIDATGFTIGDISDEEGIDTGYTFNISAQGSSLSSASSIYATVISVPSTGIIGISGDFGTITLSSPLTIKNGLVKGGWEEGKGKTTDSTSKVYGVKAGGDIATGDLIAEMDDSGSVTVSGKTAMKEIFGVYAKTVENATARNAELTIENATMSGVAIGGYAYSASKKATAEGNVFTINNGTFNAQVYGGIAVSTNGAAETAENKLTINNGTFSSNVFAGYAKTGASDIVAVGANAEGAGKATANNNTLDISGGTFNNVNARGGLAFVQSSGKKATANNNTLNISGGKFNAELTVVYSNITAGYANAPTGSAEASNNTLNISGNSSFSAPIMGAITQGVTGSGSSVSNNNTVNISGGKFSESVYAGWAERSRLDGDGMGNSTANNNSMTISGGIFTKSGVDQGIFVGYAEVLSANNTGTGVAVANNNTLTISGGTFGKDGMPINIYAGYAQVPLVDPEKGQAIANNNTMIIEGSPNLKNAVLYGGETINTDRVHFDGTSQNNTFEIRTSGLTAQNVYYFQNYTFILPSGIKNNDVVLTLTGGADKEKTNISGSTVTVGISQGVLLYPGDAIVLLRNENGLNSTGVMQKKITTEKGLALSYDFDVTATPIELLAAVSSVKASEKAKAPVEGQTVAPAMLNQAADLLATEGIQSLVAMPANGTLATFGVAQAGNLRHNTGSHTNVQGVSTLIGIGKRFDPSYGVLYTGAFFEYGYGDYSAHNDFSSGYVRGDGHSRYYGGGVMVRYDIPCGAYAEASVRFGGSESYWSSKQLGASYDSTGMYFGTHVALGWMWKFAKDFKLDLYSKYFYAYQEGDNVTILGDPFKFDSVNSNRLRLGARLGYDFNEMIAGYVGAGWEREFSGAANASVYGYDIVAPSLKGNSGIFEGGLSFKPKKDLAFSTDIGVTGYVGQKKGVTGYLKLNYSF